MVNIAKIKVLSNNALVAKYYEISRAINNPSASGFVKTDLYPKLKAVENEVIRRTTKGGKTRRRRGSRRGCSRRRRR